MCGAIYNVRSVRFNPQWFPKNLYVIRKHNVYGTLFSVKISPNLRYIHSYSQILLTHFYSSRQQQRGYDVQKEYLKRKNVTDWLKFECCQVCDSAKSPMLFHRFRVPAVGTTQNRAEIAWIVLRMPVNWFQFFPAHIQGPKFSFSGFSHKFRVFSQSIQPNVFVYIVIFQSAKSFSLVNAVANVCYFQQMALYSHSLVVIEWVVSFILRHCSCQCAI